MENDPDWAKVLAKPYRNEGRYSATGDIEALSPQEGQEEKNRNKEALKAKLQKELDLKRADNEAVEMMLNSMQQRYHVRWQIGKSAAKVTFEPDGFEVAHERELTKRQDRTNTTLVGFTLVLVLATLIGTLPKTWPFLGYELNFRLYGALTLLGVVVLYILHTGLHKDMLDL